MNSYKDIQERADKLLLRRGIHGHVAAERFVSDFKAYLIYFAAIRLGDANRTLELLENDENLTDSKILLSNFRCKLSEMISPLLREDPIFPELFKILLQNKGKGVGAGELALPLILAGYRFSNENDGIVTINGQSFKIEIKKDGASLSPVRRGITGQYEGLADDLNQKYWNGTKPGMKRKKLFENHVATVTDPKLYIDYLRELYIGCDTSDLAKKVIKVYKDADKFNSAVGHFALKEYKKVDEFSSIIIIDTGEEDGTKTKQERAKDPIIVCINDCNNIESLNLSFTPKMSRGGDSQALPDGYVNIHV